MLNVPYIINCRMHDVSFISLLYCNLGTSIFNLPCTNNAMLKAFHLLVEVQFALHIFHIAQASAYTQNYMCQDVTLQEGRDYCEVPLSAASCYVKKAKEYTKNGTSSENAVDSFWIELCAFTVPELFIENKNYYSCSIYLDCGPVTCSPLPSFSNSVASFTHNCTVALMWHNKSEDEEQIQSFIKNEWKLDTILNSSSDIMVANRYLLENFTFESNPNYWDRIAKPENQRSHTWNASLIALTAVGLSGVLFGTIYCFVTIYKKLRHFRRKTQSLDNDHVISQLEDLLSSAEDRSLTPSYEREIVDALTLSR